MPGRVLRPGRPGDSGGHCSGRLGSAGTSAGHHRHGPRRDKGPPYPATTLGAGGGTPPYTWSAQVAFQPLLPGLSPSPQGVISGTPSAAGAHIFQVDVSEMALSSSGAVPARGRNTFGQLGNGDVDASTTPVALSLPPVAAIAAGDFASQDNGYGGQSLMPPAMPAGTVVSAVATCNARTPTGIRAAAAHRGYTATFAGTPDYGPSQAAGPLVPQRRSRPSRR